ncbi:MAG TPA: hypothetical protein VJ063_05025 [Verrucomicrobiae bacterium]|nr:hypothetical protein [Verrucomicrobiae bacterium]
MRRSDEPPNHENPATLRDQERSWDLELPDAPDFVSKRWRYPLDRALEFVEEMRQMFPLDDKQRALREEVRCTEEFIL